ncbi:OLC1v1023286C1 [Oldenlandia corymbosa var. corymbosa]|uniref:OLC1v1023286C1 n=1 Tax=Oldenlandia corymbosa var. corymbosa TaxID=529605 RepID=A0AAV1C2J9_OLDCO|nr:OLC1v1023286C1 [Oldenlandia corymbosa var. corymbosa]
MGKPCEPVLCEIVLVAVDYRTLCDSLSSDGDIEEIIFESYDGSQLATSVTKGLDELPVSLPDEVLKKDTDDQPLECLHVATHDRPCDTSVDELDKVADSSLAKRNCTYARLYDRRGSTRSKRRKGKHVPHDFHCADMANSVPRLRGIDFDNCDAESVVGTSVSYESQAGTYAWLNYVATVEWRFDLINDYMRPSGVRAFEAKTTCDKSNSVPVRNTNDVTIQHEADHKRKSVVPTVDAKATDTQESVAADDGCKNIEPMFIQFGSQPEVRCDRKYVFPLVFDGRDLVTDKERVKGSSDTPSFKTQNASEGQYNSVPTHKVQFQPVPKVQHRYIDNTDIHRYSSRSSGTTNSFG